MVWSWSAEWRALLVNLCNVRLSSVHRARACSVKEGTALQVGNPASMPLCADVAQVCSTDGFRLK